MRSRISNTVFLMLHTSVHKKIFSVQDKHPSCSSSPFGQSRGRGLAVVEEGGGGGDATPTSEGEAASLPHPHHHHHLHPSGAVSLSAAIQRISSQHNVSITVQRNFTKDISILYPETNMARPGIEPGPPASKGYQNSLCCCYSEPQQYFISMYTVTVRDHGVPLYIPGLRILIHFRSAFV